MDTLIIFPEPGEQKRIAKELIELAGAHPMQVEYVLWPEPGFRVPVELGDRFVAKRLAEQQGQDEVPAVAEEAVPTGVEPVKRKPGRPKKVQEG